LIDCLLRVEVLTNSDSETVHSKLSLNDTARETIKILQRKSDDSFEKFISALTETEQGHVVHILTGAGSSPMSKEHRKLLRSKKEELEMFCDPVNGVISALAAANAVNSGDEARIRRRATLNEMAGELAETLTRKADDAFNAFVTALNKTGQNHVTYILTGEGDSQPVSEECRAKLKAKRFRVVKSIYADCIVSSLISKGVFSSYDQQRVDSRLIDDKKGEMIVNLIAIKSQSVFGGFIDTLNECHHDHVATELMGIEIVGEIQTQVSTEEEMVRADSDLVEEELRNNMQQAFTNKETAVNVITNDVLSLNGISQPDIEDGSIIVKFRCRDHAALVSLGKLFTSKQLEQLFTKVFCPRFAEKDLRALSLKIEDEEFERHKELKLMTDEHREALLSSAERLDGKLTVKGELLDKLSLCRRRRQTIERAGTHQQQVRTLTDIVSRQPDSAFTQLLELLPPLNLYAKLHLNVFILLASGGQKP